MDHPMLKLLLFLLISACVTIHGLGMILGHLRRVISINRNLNFFTSGYNYLIQLIPVMIVAPLFIRREVEFGVIGQATMAFATLLGAFSLVITQFQAISAYASVLLRLGEFVDAAEECQANNSAGDTPSL